MKKKHIYLLTFALGFSGAPVFAQTTLTLDVDHATRQVSPHLYGLMTEEINHSYDGGLYGELIRNRSFKDNPTSPEGWSLVQDKDGGATMKLGAPDPYNVSFDDRHLAINDALTTCLKLIVPKSGSRTGIANSGFWGIAVRPSETYTASLYIKSPAAGPVTLAIESSDGSTTYASAQLQVVKAGWTKYSAVLQTGATVKATADARFVISVQQAGTYCFNLVSLFPKAYANRKNGNRADLMQLMADMKPTFLRFPGGNFLEGAYLGTRFNWKNTIGPVETRAGHWGPWGYRSTDGMGLLEFLEWCQDLKIEPLLAVYGGYSLAGDHVQPGRLLDPYVQDALDEIEYVSGDVHSYWGSIRAKDGHPEPFYLSCVEIGNEDYTDGSGSYDGRYVQFSRAIHAKYPQLTCISTIEENRKNKVTSVRPDMVDEHFYRNAQQMEADVHHYDNYDRKGPKIFVGEWATREGAPTTNMNAALGDAAWMTGMERNSDIVLRSCYAPLFVNVSPDAMQWESDLIGYDAISSYGSPSYYAQLLFNNYLGDRVVSITGSITPGLFYVCTKNTKIKLLFLKIVNTTKDPQLLQINLNTTEKIAKTGVLTVLKSSSPEDTNTISDPKKIVPVTTVLACAKQFNQTLAPYSINVIQIQLK